MPRYRPGAIDLLDRTVVVNDPAISGRYDQMHVKIEIELDDGMLACRRKAAAGGQE